MYKLTAGIFAGILTIVTVNAARADIATTTYVQGGVNAAKAYADTEVGKVSAKVGDVATLDTTNKSNTVAAINEVKDAVDTVAGNMVNSNDDFNAETESTTKYPTVAYVTNRIETSASQVQEALEVQYGKQDDEIEALKTKVGNTPVATQITTEIEKLDGNVTGDTGVVKTISQTDGKITATRAAIIDGDIATGTIAKDKLVDAVQASLTKADNALPAATYEGQVGTVSKTAMGTTTATTVVGGIKEAMEAAAAAKTAAETAASTASDSYALKTDVGTVSTLTTSAKTVVGAVNELDKELGTITATAMGTDATTVSAAIKEVAQEAADAQAAANTANTEIATIKAGAVMTSGATKAKIDQIETNTTNITNITKDGGTIDAKINAAKTTINASLDGKIDESTTLAGKTLTTDATTGQLKDAAAAAGEKLTCDAATDGEGCEVVLMSTGTGFKWVKIINTYK